MPVDYNKPPFARGVSMANTTDIARYEGKIFEFEDINPTSPFTLLSKERVKCRLVKNTALVALLPGYLLPGLAANYFAQAAGYARLTAGLCAGVVDEYLPTAGVPAGYYFWAVVQGPTSMQTDLAAGANNLLPAETVLVALTAVTSQATTAGRVAPQDLSGATALLGAQLYNQVGIAISARTTANTNVGIRAFATMLQ